MFIKVTTKTCKRKKTGFKIYAKGKIFLDVLTMLLVIKCKFLYKTPLTYILRYFITLFFGFYFDAQAVNFLRTNRKFKKLPFYSNLVFKFIFHFENFVGWWKNWKSISALTSLNRNKFLIVRNIGKLEKKMEARNIAS